MVVGASQQSGSLPAPPAPPLGTVIAKLVDPDTARNAQFGNAVAVYGSTVVAGCQVESSAIIYRTDGTRVAKLTEPNFLFGAAVGVSEAAVVVGQPTYRTPPSAYGAYNSGVVRVYSTDGSQELVTLSAGDKAVDGTSPRFGTAVAISGEKIVVGACKPGFGGGAGAAYVYNTAGTQLAKLLPSSPDQYSFFGDAVAISGDTIVVGARNARSTSSSSNRIGAAYVFDAAGTQLATLAVVDATSFGQSVAISGDTVIVGSNGAAYVFDTAGTLLRTLTRAASGFGVSVGISDSVLLVGSSGDSSSPTDAGAVHVYSTAGAELATLSPTGAGTAYDKLGEVIALSGSIIVAGAAGDDNHGEDFGSAGSTGAVYIYAGPP